MKVRQTDRTLRSFFSSLIVVGLCSSCGDAVDSRFAAETYDEYTERLSNAVIGTPEGTIVIPEDEEHTASISLALGPDAGPTGGSGGSSISGSSSSGSSSSSSSATSSSAITGSGGSGSPAGGVGGSKIGSGGFAGTGTAGRGGAGGAFGDGGIGGDDSGFGFWHFDDCSPTSHFLRDSSGFGANAQHELDGACVSGVSGLAVKIRNAKDIVQVPDEPQFTVGQRVAVAAWVRPNTVAGDQPIVIKRLNNQTSFSLGVHKGNIEMSVVLANGKTIISRAPISPGVFTHVAGMYDGTFVFLFINGQQFGQVFASGGLRNVFAPVRIGATTQTQFFNGVIDDVFVSTNFMTKEQLAALSCIQNPSTLAVSPPTSGVVPAGTTVHYDIAVSNNDIGACSPGQYQVFVNSPPGFSVVPQFNFAVVDPGTIGHFGTDVTSSVDADPGVNKLPFDVRNFVFPPIGNPKFEFLTGELTYEVAEPTGCFVRPRRELMITDLSVVDDPVRTSGNGAPSPVFDGGRPPPFDAGVRPDVAVFDAAPPSPAPAASRGVWSFGHLMRELAPTPEDAPAMAEQVFRSFLTDQVVNGFTVPARPAMDPVVLANWPRTPDGKLDLDRAPVTLQAIVNRIDIRDLTLGSGGEGRFVFGVNSGFGALEFTLIFEYNLPAHTEQDVRDWANLWHGLSSHPFPSEEYNMALEDITRRFTRRGASPGSVNDSALLSFRSNEIALSFVWQFRQFDLSPGNGFFRQVPLSDTPDFGFNGTPTFANFVNQNAEKILAAIPGGMANTVPAQFEGMNFQAGSIFNSGFDLWFAPGIVNPDARFQASLGTCNGCHGGESGSSFLQITPRGLRGGGEAQLAPFITGTTVFDQFTGQVRTLNDLARRRADLTSLVCPTDGGAPPPPPPPPPDARPLPPPQDAGVGPKG